MIKTYSKLGTADTHQEVHNVWLPLYEDQKQAKLSVYLWCHRNLLGMCMRKFSGMKETIFIFTGFWITQVQTFVKTHQPLHLGSMPFTVCKLYLN